MSQTDDKILSDGRKVSDLKVLDLKKELDKLNKPKNGSKSELIQRLNEALDENLNHSENERKVTDTNQDIEDTREVKNTSKIKEPDTVPQDNAYKGDSVDLDDVGNCSTEISQNVETLDLEAPVDESLNPIEEIANEEIMEIDVDKLDEVEDDLTGEDVDEMEEDASPNDISVVISNKTDVDIEDSECREGSEREQRLVTCKNTELCEDDSEAVTDKGAVISGGDEKVELYETFLNSQMEMELATNDRQVAVKSEALSEKNDLARTDHKLTVDAEPMEEGEVVPISARLGRRPESDNKKTTAGLKEVKGTGHKTEEPIRVNGPTKCRRSANDVLKLSNLVRPFTLGQLQDMIKGACSGDAETRGKSVRDVWLNRIKSVAYARFESVSVASSARERLDGCRWPSINPKLLSVDFSDSRELEWMKEHGDSGTAPPSKFPRAKSRDHRSPPVASSKEVKKEEQHSHRREVVNSSSDHHRREHDHRGTASHGESSILRRLDQRDSHKSSQQQHPLQRLDNAPNKSRHRSRSPIASLKRKMDTVPTKHERKSDHTEQSAKDTKNAAKMLEDLFKKTVAQPSIYWMPATKEKQEELRKLKELIRPT